ncbi:TMEM1 family protein-like protein [Mollisia scopiformis]|uniref:TMEM1 family protein-like protein n=1 Tax=Mollisia scopiformis TaxID=149040 RepID=A0A194XQH4_MOLSC|nr:TMEM1 family protein-like protein [Mollisia scopiformis]KUJ22443.1 TMEM1 family protein-like protein [Mollisia scopiformis]
MEETSSSSKVTVEYFDPYGVYQLLSPGLLPRLPLRNLHWNSHSGPLRSISTLHIDLQPSAQDIRPLSTLNPASASTSSLSRVKSEDSAASGDDGFRTQALSQPAGDRPASVSGPVKPVKERRHQIPGLRQTPYLKVFFLRCDDNDTYKNQARRQVREWIKDHTPPAQSTSKNTPQENHDAYEWLIIHVIVPNTAAATQPRTGGKSSEGGSSSISEKSGPRWRGGGSSTILEKLRADFNGTSKSAVDRVAQIRIGINDVPYDMLPRVVPAIPGSYSETPQENENAWLDLVSKLKSLILASFDGRVSQYEEDIREKDAQRSLPGWNFCTFFVLKEGLARGFENVGLVEDALVGYDELAVGLDAIIREQSSTGSSVARGGSFLPYTEDLKRRAEKARAAILRDMGAGDAAESDEPIDLQSTTKLSGNEDDEIPLNASKKRYRELILANDISIFDFRCYLFARQLSLLLRLANAWSSQEELLAKLKEQRESSLQGVAARLPASQPADDAEVLNVLGEICRRSMTFVSSISRIMREDISASFQASNATGDTQVEIIDPIMTQVVDNIVSSFTFGISQQILAQTSTKSLPIPPSTLAPPSSRIGLDGQEPKAAIPEPKTMMHPARSSSLALRSSSREPPSPGRFPGGRRSSVPEQGAASSPFLKAGLEQLAGHRAELYVLSRSILEQVGKERGWSSGWAEMEDLHSSGGGEMEDIDLNQEPATVEASTLSKIPPSSYGIENKLLQTAVDNKDDFYRLYETLTDKALRHFTVANHIQSVQSNMADLAILKYHLGDYAAAASYFYRMTPFYGEGGWAQVELSMLIMYAKCLRELQRKEEYVKVVLKLLSKSAMVEKERLQRKSSFQIGSKNTFSPEVLPTESYLSDLLEITKTLPHEVHVPLQNFFAHIEVDNTVRYHPEMDSFGLQLRLHYLLSESITIDKAKVKIVSLLGETSREIWLEMEGDTVFGKGMVKLAVKSNTLVPGTYIATQIILQSSNITLQYDHNSASVPCTKAGSFFRSPKLLIYHRTKAFDVRLFASRYMHLDRNRSLEIELLPGWNTVASGEIHVRAATAGLRVQTSETKLLVGSLEIFKKSEPGIVRFGAMEQQSRSRLVMPFNLEHEVGEISLKIEITYTTEKGVFFFATTPSVSISLPLGVNVQDVFKHKALFSKFTISSSTSSPIRLLSSRLEGSEVFGAEGGVPISKPLVVFPRQPATMLYKITKLRSLSKPEIGSRKGPKSSLSLVLNYTCIEEEIENAVTEDLSQFLEKKSLDSYARLMVPVVLAELRSHLSSYDFEKTAILNEISTSILSSINWRDHFSGLGREPESSKDTALVMEECLHSWVQQKSSISLAQVSIEDESMRNSRSIVIPVDIPSVTVVHTADFKLLDPPPAATNMVIAASNQPISASLDIKWTRIWDTEIPSETGAGSQNEYIEFFYEVSGASDTWLIGGRRKGHFRIPRIHQEHDTKAKLSFPVVLIPLREGFLPFPNVDIKPAHSLKHVGYAEDETPRLKRPVVTCETDYKNAGETLRVISDARKTTVSLDASGPQGGAWLLESERRSPGNGGIVLG